MAEEKIYEKVAQKIRNVIKTENLEEGEQLPSERVLAQNLSVSRHSVREAIRKLEQEGILKTKAGSGTYVFRRNEQSKVLNSLATAVIRQKDKIRDIMQIRMILEPQVAGLAAQTATQGDIIYLEEVLHLQKMASSSNESTRYDSEFHLGIARATGNLVLVDIYHNINEVFNRYREGVYHSKERTLKSYVNHLKILDAIRVRNVTEAQKMMQIHLEKIGAELSKNHLNLQELQ